MGRKERKRWDGIDAARNLIEQSRSRSLTPEEIVILKKSYTGYGGLCSSNWNNGQYFTPTNVIQFIYNMLNVTPTSYLLEPSCGAGSFFEFVPKYCKATGVEMMDETAEVARLCYPNVEVVTGDTLEMLDLIENQYHYVVGNPPYMNINNKYEGFTIAKKSKRAEWYFIELAVRALKPGGKLALVLPDGVLSNSRDKPIREWLMNECIYLGTVSLPVETFKPTGTTVKTSVIIAHKKVPGVKYGIYDVLMAVCEDIGWDIRLKPTGKCDLDLIFEEYSKHRSSQIKKLA